MEVYISRVDVLVDNLWTIENVTNERKVKYGYAEIED